MKKNLLVFSGIAFLFLSLTFIFSIGCQRELHEQLNDSNNPSPTGPVVNDNEMVIGGVRGIVVDEYNRPVKGATVVSGTKTATTDRYGTFSFSNINLSKANGYVKVTKAGYFTGSRTFISKAGRIHNVRIKLLPKANTGSFSAASGGTVTLAGGGKLVIPADAITAAGSAYSGTVNVAMTWINPEATDLPDIVPGDLRGITTSGEERGLQTYGMLGVELTGSTGQELKIATGKTAELTFPLPASMQGSAPSSIDLWHFDEATGRWKQEGTATKSGSNYIAQVSHFSFWNCDAPFPLVEVCMTIVNASNNTPLNNVQVKIKRPNGSAGYGRTDSLGNLCGKVPQNEALELQVLGQCNNLVYSQNIGPFSGNISIGTIAVAIPTTNTLIISGILVDCNNANVANGAAVIYTGNGNSYSVPVTNGTFSLSLVRCDNVTVNFSVLGVDYTALQQGTPVSGSGTTGTVNVGTIQACGTSSAQFVEFMIDGTPYTYAAPPDNISSIDSTTAGAGNVTVFAFKVSGGSTNTTTYSNFRFASDGTTGVKVLQQCRVSADGLGVAEVITSANPTVNITTYGSPVSGFIEGNFSIQMNFAGTPKNVVCTFRVRRS